LSVRQAADRLGVPIRTLYEWCRLGKFPHSRVGPRRILILQSTVDGLLAPGTPSPGVIARVAATEGDPW
jgi:excisionase family DNA binding protein